MVEENKMTDADMKVAFDGWWNKAVLDVLPEMNLETFLLLKITSWAAFKAGHELK